jgi:phosphopantetheine adenylyltransferase
VAKLTPTSAAGSWKIVDNAIFIFDHMSVEVNDRKQAQQFYNETKRWQSEMNSLVIDLMFLKRILDIYGLKISDAAEQRDINHLKETLTSFVEFRVEKQKSKLKTHEDYLQRIVEDRILLRDRELPYKHQDMKTEVEDFWQGGASLKNELYTKVEQLKQF